MSEHANGDPARTLHGLVRVRLGTTPVAAAAMSATAPGGLARRSTVEPAPIDPTVAVTLHRLGINPLRERQAPA